MSKTLKAHLYLFAAALIYGANYPLAKSVMPEPFAPVGFIFMRVLGAGLLFWFIRIWVKEHIASTDWWRLVLCGITGVATNQLFFFMGLERTSPINASIIMTTTPILVMVLAALILRNPITLRKGTGVLLGAIGAVGIILLSRSDSSNLSNPVGDLFILINAISYGLYLVLVKPLMAKYQPLTVISYVFLFGFLVVAPVGFSSFRSIEWSQVDVWAAGVLAFVILGTTFLTYLFNILAIRHVQPTVSSAYIYFQPILSGLFSWLLSLFTTLNYTGDFSGWKAGCALLIFAGVYLVSVSRGSRRGGLSL